MKKLFVLLLIIVNTYMVFGQSGALPPSKKSAPVNVYDFQFFKLKDTIEITVISFFKNDAACFAEGIPYALIIGAVNNTNYPKIISVLAICDENVYHIGEKLKISSSNDARIGSSLHPIYFMQDTIINKHHHRHLTGSEYPAVWANVLH